MRIGVDKIYPNIIIILFLTSCSHSIVSNSKVAKIDQKDRYLNNYIENLEAQKINLDMFN